MSTYTVGGIKYDTATGRPITEDGGFLLDQEKNDPRRLVSNSKKRNRKLPNNLRYPENRIQDDSDYLQIQVIEYQPPGFARRGEQALALRTSSQSLFKKNKENLLGTIYLPVPETVTDSNGVTWGEDTLNGLAAVGLGVFGDMITADDIGQALVKGMGRGVDALKQGVTDKTSRQAINSTFASMAVNAFGGTISPEAVLARQSGAILNPNMELLFGGVQLRTFSFDFDFAPRDTHESETVKKIIRAFKVSMNAKNGSLGDNPSSGLFIKSPDIFKLTYKTGNKDHKFLHKFKPMALLNMAVNYTGAGTYATYDNTAPIHMKMSLTFQELNPIYSEDYDTDEGLEGTGF